MIVVITKYDAWASLLPGARLTIDRVIRSGKNSPLSAVDLKAVEDVSAQTRALLREHSPEIVVAAEGFARQVVYIPVSALGCGPELDPTTRMLGIRPRDVRPVWVEVPMIYALCRWMKGLIPHLAPKAPPAPGGKTSPEKTGEATGTVPFPRVWTDTGT